MGYSVRSGPREHLVATLRRLWADRAQTGETRRADEAAEAADILEAGGDAAYFERVIYAVGEPDRWSVLYASPAEALTQLKDLAIGWDHQGKPQLAAQAVDGYERVEAGAEMVRVGHLLYLIVE